MRDNLHLKVAVAVRVRDFLGAHPFDYQPADQVAARFAENVRRAQFLLTQRETGKVASKASTRQRRALKDRMVRMPLRHLSRIAKSLVDENPGVASGFPRPALGRSEEDFQASVRAIVQEVGTQKELYLQHGLSEESLEELARMLAEYERAVVEANAGRRAHTGAQAELKVVARELMRMLQQLDGIIVYRFREQPELLGAWQSARNIAWPAAESKPEAPAEGSGSAA